MGRPAPAGGGGDPEAYVLSHQRPEALPHHFHPQAHVSYPCPYFHMP